MKNDRHGRLTWTASLLALVVFSSTAACSAHDEPADPGLAAFEVTWVVDGETRTATIDEPAAECTDTAPATYTVPGPTLERSFVAMVDGDAVQMTVLKVGDGLRFVVEDPLTVTDGTITLDETAGRVVRHPPQDGVDTMVTEDAWATGEFRCPR